MEKDELRYPTFQVVIRRVSDGLTRVYTQANEWGEGSWFYWTDGNCGCDCNRALSFSRAADEDEPEDLTCGNEAFQVLLFIFPDGLTIDGPDRKSIAS